ncbi:MAG: AAA family ATPase [Lachnospiraceae bacterium]|nr:AAA family ATPase [Lachnospiraceae bacterium]
MNIKEAKDQIKNSMIAYFSKDEFGNYIIPIEKQRPIFMIGAPGIGKTAIMKQIAEELGVGLVSYSMTHHTRQSALGLPIIKKKNYNGVEYDISRYSMSEIIASAYDMMEDTGIKEGILFLDEINCVSETLAPSMLQFLQYKIFGQHRLPDGWIVVTAGNPPEYNKSVREYDIVTLDRLKVINVEPNFDVWKEYALNNNVHGSILSFLEIKKEFFYIVETTAEGKNYVTARGWEDLSKMIYLYEKNNIKVDESLISQYIHHKAVSKEFAVYYDLYNKYKSDYQIGSIVNGNATEDIKNRARLAKFDERISLLGLLIDNISSNMASSVENEVCIMEYLDVLKYIKAEITGDFTKIKEDEKKEREKRIESEKNIENEKDLLASGVEVGENNSQLKIRVKRDPKLEEDKYKKLNYMDSLNKHILEEKQKLNIYLTSGTLTPLDLKKFNYVIKTLMYLLEEFKVEGIESNDTSFELIRRDYEQRVAAHTKRVEITKNNIENVFKFVEEVFGEGQEMVILVAELTTRYAAAKFISTFGSDSYFKHNKEVLFYERKQELLSKIDELS